MFSGQYLMYIRMSTYWCIKNVKNLKDMMGKILSCFLKKKQRTWKKMSNYPDTVFRLQVEIQRMRIFDNEKKGHIDEQLQNTLNKLQIEQNLT